MKQPNQYSTEASFDGVSCPNAALLEAEAEEEKQAGERKADEKLKSFTRWILWRTPRKGKKFESS